MDGTSVALVKEKFLTIKSLVDIVGEVEVEKTLFSMSLSLSRRELIRLMLVSSYEKGMKEVKKKDAVIA